MDEEDLREAEESRHLDTAEEFAGFGTEHDPRQRDALIDLFRPPVDTVGSRLLKVMGWREDSNPHAVDIKVPPKHDRRGLGYGDEPDSNSVEASKPKHQDEQHQNDFAGLRELSRVSKVTKAKKGAFGVGILNDTGSDEDDPYAIGPDISYNRVIGTEKKQKKKTGPGVTTANPKLKSKPVFLSKEVTNLHGALRKCHDGRLPPDGFVLADDLDALASLPLQADKYKPPEVPTSWKSTYASDTDVGNSTPSTDAAAKTSVHTAKSRANALGEDQLPGKSVFDFISPAARDRLAHASGRPNLPPGLGEAPANGTVGPDTAEENLQDLVPKLEQSIAMQALQRGNGGWMPYAEDERKRERYKAYLEIRAGLKQDNGVDELPPRAEGMSKDGWVVEMQEFARAAHVFKPVTGDMATRFTSSTSNLPSSSSLDSATGVDTLLSKPKAKPEDPAEAAARMGLFGQMTRSLFNFYPSRLLCKRFGVSMPEHSTLPEQPSTSTVAPEVAASLVTSRFQSAGFQKDDAADPVTKIGDRLMSGAELGTKQTQQTVNSEKNEALEQDRPSQALFKAIFGSDSEDD
jgi:G patch domain-containing protein 1